ncbi:MAG: M3 family oligoendopeptidase [Actinomycetota bacterium]
MAQVETKLPHWDMTTVFPALDSPEFDSAFADLGERIVALRQGLDDRPLVSAGLDDGNVARFDELVVDLNAILERITLVQSYLYSFVTTDSQNDVAQTKNSELSMRTVDLAKVQKRIVAWVGTIDADELISKSGQAMAHAFAVRKMARDAKHQMAPELEDLTISLAPSARVAWGKLHGNVTSRVIVDFTKPDGSRELVPLAGMGRFAQDADPAIREAAFRATLAAYPDVEVPLAAALNSIKGWENELNTRRGWPDSIEPALFNNNVDRATLDAMQQACMESFPDFHRYYLAKAKALGKDKMTWWDQGAPVGSADKKWSWDECASFIVEQFGTYSERMANLAARAFQERWVDAEPRRGKRGGAFCMGVRKDESRILTNYNDNFTSVTTVAHELGHAFHNVNLAEKTPIQRSTPMALAETASTFCENIVLGAMLRDATGDERLAILNESLTGAGAIVVHIHSRFLFEKFVYESREQRELAPAELNEAMSKAQREVFGEALDPEATHPYMWCVSPHYYSTAYYNWPYTFGLLFGLGLYRFYEQDAETFRANYDELLSSTGTDDAAGLCARFGIDVRTPDFWRSSLDVLRGQIDDFVTLVK